MDTFTFVIGAFLVVAMVTDIAAAYLLIRTAIDSLFKYIALNERAFVAGVQAVSGTLLGILGANRIFEWHLPSEIALITLALAMGLQALPAIIWLVLYYQNKFSTVGHVEE